LVAETQTRVTQRRSKYPIVLILILSLCRFITNWEVFPTNDTYNFVSQTEIYTTNNYLELKAFQVSQV
jgi:hypothetical protein